MVNQIQLAKYYFKYWSRSMFYVIYRWLHFFWIWQINQKVNF